MIAMISSSSRNCCRRNFWAGNNMGGADPPPPEIASSMLIVNLPLTAATDNGLLSSPCVAIAIGEIAITVADPLW